MKKRAADKKRKNLFSFLRGNFFFVLALFCLFLAFFPALFAYTIPISFAKTPSQSNFSLSIPEINASAPIIPNVDPWNESIYRKALEKGVAEAKGSAPLDGKGTVYLFAHSSDVPWRMLSENIAFFRLPQLQIGDMIFIYNHGETYRYAVREKKEVWPNEVSYLTHLKKKQLVLQTCVPIGTSLKRLLVFADPVPASWNMIQVSFLPFFSLARKNDVLEKKLVTFNLLSYASASKY